MDDAPMHKMLNIIRILFLWFFMTLVLKGEANLSGNRPIALGTTTMIADMIENVGGQDIDVICLIGPSVDPHLYKPTAQDTFTLRKSDIIFYNGFHLEGKMNELFEKMKNKGKRVYALTDIFCEKDAVNPSDPHIWLDPLLWMRCVDVVVRGLSIVDEANKTHYLQEGNALKKKYRALHTWIQGRIEEVPQENRILITSHDAFNYFGHAYGFEVIGIQGLSTSTEAGLADMARIVDLITAKKVKAIFIESSVSPATIERISRDAKVKIGGELFSDSTGIRGEIETDSSGATYDLGTYEGLIRHNVNTIVDALK